MDQIKLVNDYFDSNHFAIDEYAVEKARAAMLAYCLHYGDESHLYEVVGVETPFCLPIPGMDGELYGGFIDYIRKRRDGGLVICDLKTASSVGDSYWQELYTNEQLTTYLLALKQHFSMVGLDCPTLDVQWDVILKPTISPKKLTKAAVKELTEQGTYEGTPCDDCEIREDGEESPKQYGLRCLNWYLEKPDSRFYRRSYTRNDDQLVEHVDSVTRRVTEIRVREADAKLGIIPPPSFGACKRFGTGATGSMCDYHLICSGADPTKVQYKIKEQPKDRISIDGMSVSQLRCSDVCRREHHYKYVERIVPIIKPPSDAMDLGTVIHGCFEHLMRSQMTNPLTLTLLTKGDL